jgi:hypothetical protein
LSFLTSSAVIKGICKAIPPSYPLWLQPSSFGKGFDSLAPQLPSREAQTKLIVASGIFRRNSDVTAIRQFGFAEVLFRIPLGAKR